MIKAGSFREDLYYRLAEIVVKIPTLAERHGDATLLAKHFLNRFSKEMNPAVRGFTPARWRRSTTGHGPATFASWRTA
jgi:two-component system NtrC family response regulator